MAVPALIIGLGGTGSWVATYVKKELLELGGNHRNQVQILAYDTVSQSEATIGGSGQIRGRGETTGGVRLGAGEFFFIGGNVQQLMREVARGQHDHLRSWLLADWYLQTLADKTFNLNEGAGQFRQFGRMAIFKDVAAPSNSVIFGTLNDALVKLKRDNPTMTGLQVFIVGSIAGGTGAGMFIDIAHLVRELSAQPNINLKGKMTIRGYLVLPDAFSRTVDQAWLRSMYARAYAGMRESRRFTVNFDYEQGYPMTYHDGSGHPIWHGAIKGKLFDLLYFLDGQGGQNRLGSATLPHGVAPAIADAISAAIDGQAGSAFAAYVTNIEAERAQRIARGNISNKTATYGSVGTYTLVFPIFHIVEGWAHDLGLALLNQLLVPATFDERSGLPTALAADANQEYLGEPGREAGYQFLRANRPITYEERDEGGNVRTEQIEPTLLPGELARIAAEASRPNSGVVQMLVGRHIADWEPTFAPHGQDRETRRLMQRVQGVLDRKMYARPGTPDQGEVLASDQHQQKENPALGAERIIQEVRVFKNRYLGNEDARTGQRTGGQYRNSLSEIVTYQVRRFALLLDRQMQSVLNGQPNSPALMARGGKLGFLKDFLGGLFEALELSRDTLRQVQKIRRERGDSRRNALADTRANEQAMKQSADKKGLLGRPAGEAFQTQHRYLSAEMRLIDLLQVEATEDAIIQTINLMLDYVLSAVDSVKEWEQVLARQQDGLYSKLTTAKGLLDSDRQAAKDVVVRHIVSDADYERSRYRAYLARVDGGWMEQLMGRFRWRLEHKRAAGRPKAQLVLTAMTGEGQTQALQLDRPDDNLQLWLKLCRQPFDTARREESLISYLVSHPVFSDPTELGDLIHKNSGTLLNFSGGDPLPANFLRAYFQSAEEAGHTNYLRSVIQHLAQKSGQSVVEEVRDEATGEIRVQESRFARFLNSDDRFKLTLVFTEELIELERMASYTYNGEQAYLSTEDRRLLHAFPAEVNTASFESRLPELQQKVRLFSDDVTLQLENLSRFKLFLMCYVYGLVRREGERDERDNQYLVWKLFLPPAGEFTSDGRRAVTEEIWLTHRHQEPHILNALMTFNYIGLDARQQTDNIVVPIDHDAVGRTLARVRTEDAERRLAADTAGEASPDLLGQLKDLDEDARKKQLLELARIDAVREREAHFVQRVLPAYQKNLGNPDNQKDYDISSVFTLMLRDEARNVRQTVRDGIKSLRGIGAEKLTPFPESDERVDMW